MKYLLAILAAILVACAPTAETTPEPVVVPPPEPVEPEPVEEVMEDSAMMEDSEEVESGLDKAFGEADTAQIITVDDVICDSEQNALQFRFRNLGDVNWELNQNVPFPPPKDLTSVRILINNYEANGRGAFVQGVRQFGPEEKFSENCGGIEILAPGDEASCFLQPVPLRDENALGAAVNEISLNTAGTDGTVRFTCE